MTKIKGVPSMRQLPDAPQMKTRRDYVTEGLTPETIAPIFKEADQGDMTRQAQLFEQLREHDGHVLSESDKRINAITSQYLDWQVTPSSDSQRDLEVSAFVQKYVIEHPEWTGYKRAQQAAVGQGFAGLAPIWDQSSGQAIVKKFEYIENKRLIFRHPLTGFLEDWPRLATDQHPEGAEIHQRALFFHKYGGLAGHPARSGVFRPVTWMVVFKHFAIKDWWTFSELCGIPLRIGYYNSASSPEDREDLGKALEEIGVDFHALISENTKIDFINAANKTTGTDLWKEQATFTNNEISKALVGSASFSEAGKSGSYALHTLETGVRADLTLADAQETAITDLNQWIAPLIGYNFGWNTPLPQFNAVFKKQDDLKTKAEWLEPVVDRIGDTIPLTWYRKQYGIPELQEGEETLKQSQQEVIAKMPKDITMRVKDAQKEIDKLVLTSTKMVDLRGNEQIILEVIKKAKTWEEVYTGLADIFEDLDMDQLHKVLKDSILMAKAAGVSNVVDA